VKNTEQNRISQELDTARNLVAASEVKFETIDAALQGCLNFLSNCHDAYQDASHHVRRRLNQAVFERFLVGEDGSAEAELADAFGILLAPDLVTQRKNAKLVDQVTDLQQPVRHRNRDWGAGSPTWLRAAAGTKKPRPAFAGMG